MSRKIGLTSNPTVFNLLPRVSTLTADRDAFFVRKILQVALFINFCGSLNACCPPKRFKETRDVMKQQLFEAYLPNLLQRRFKQRRQVAKRADRGKKKVCQKAVGFGGLTGCILFRRRRPNVSRERSLSLSSDQCAVVNQKISNQ